MDNTPENAIGNKDDFVIEVTQELLEEKPELKEQGAKVGEIVPDYEALQGKHIDGETGLVFDTEEDYLAFKNPEPEVVPGIEGDSQILSPVLEGDPNAPEEKLPGEE